MRSKPALAWCALIFLLGACAGQSGAPGTPGSSIVVLEAAVRRDSVDADALVQLGRAYVMSSRPTDAVRVLERAQQLRGRDPEPPFLLGLIADDANDLAAARRLYERSLGLQPSKALARQIDVRLRMVARREFAATVRQALLDEQRLVNRPPEPRTVAIFPFVYRGDQAEYQPLGRALSELLVTDLSQTGRLRVLERARVQALIDEMKLGQSGLVDTTTTARGGRLLGAAHIVQGQLLGNEAGLKVEAAVVGVAEGKTLAPFSEETGARQLLEAEKRLAFSVYRALGIQLTAAEIASVQRNSTQNFQALLAFGQGLEAEDNGDFARALTRFQEAARLDPGFQPAREHAQAAGDLVTATTLTTADAAQAAQGEPSDATSTGAASGSSLSAAPTPLQGLDPVKTLVPDPSFRNAVSEALGRESLTSRAILRLIFRLP